MSVSPQCDFSKLLNVQRNLPRRQAELLMTSHLEWHVSSPATIHAGRLSRQKLLLTIGRTFHDAQPNAEHERDLLYSSKAVFMAHTKTETF